MAAKRPRDTNQLAWQIVQEATGQAPKQARKTPHVSAAAAALGGRARAAAMPAASRSAVARKAAAARWGKKR